MARRQLRLAIGHDQQRQLLGAKRGANEPAEPPLERHVGSVELGEHDCTVHRTLVFENRCA